MRRRQRSWSSNFGTGAVALTLPTGWAENDIFLIFTESSQTEAVTAPSGYTEHPNSPVIGTGTRMHCFWKRATASESGPTIADPGDHCIAVMVAIEGAIQTGSPFVASATGTASGTSYNAPDAVTTDDGQIAVCAIAMDVDANGFFGPFVDIGGGATDALMINAEQPAMNDLAYRGATSGNGGQVAVLVGVIPTTGTTVDATGTVNTGNQVMLTTILAAEPSDDISAAAGHIITVLDQFIDTSAVVAGGQIITVLTAPFAPPLVGNRRRGFMSFTPN